MDDYLRHFNRDNYKIFNDELKLIREARNKKALKDEKPSADKHELVGLALSGGGIRSATFNLGFLQALNRLGFMKHVDYLSTVSGGGYIGSCLTSLLNSDFDKDKNHFPENDAFPFANNSGKLTDGRPLRDNMFEAMRDQEPVRHLRYFSNYLTSSGNFMDRYIKPLMVMARGIVLNFFMMVPYILLIGLCLNLFFYEIPAKVDFNQTGRYLLDLGALSSALEKRNTSRDELRNYVNMNSVAFSQLPYNERLEILSRTGRHSKIIASLNKTLLKDTQRLDEIKSAAWRLPLILFGIMAFLNLIFLSIFSQSFKARFTFSAFLCCLLLPSIVLFGINMFGLILVYWHIPPGVTLVSVLSFFVPKLLGGKDKKDGPRKTPWVKIAASLFLLLLAPLFLLVLMDWTVKLLIPHVHSMLGYGWIAIDILALYLISAISININKISLHNFYRDRLSRAYLIQADTKDEHDAGLFAKIKHKDNLPLSKLKANVLPYHIINCNLNLTKTIPDVDKHDRFYGGTIRNGESFIFSRNWCGSETTGYQQTRSYENYDSHLNLGTAMAISGAAVNVGMANNDIPLLRPLLALLNIRLGYWAYQPCKIKDGILAKLQRHIINRGPGSFRLMMEIFGLYPEDGTFINLSDGGHFDNIGVYELLRRRCKFIIVGDAEADPEMSFQALSYIIRLARIDFGIEIDIDISDVRLDEKTGMSRQHCALGTIRYPRVDGLNSESGYLLYCKSSLTGDEPQHIHEYRTKNPTFPHQTTADQWFDEQQFEVYRELGYHIGKRTLSPAIQIESEENLEATFKKLKLFWHPRCPEVETYFTKHTQELNAIINLIKNDKDLSFMDAQMFPEWHELMSDMKPMPVRQLWLPESSIKVRKGFYLCNLMIQLMENVYLDLNLDKHYNHPDNRGWMNLFRRWRYSGMLRITWAINAGTFGARFQSFCKDRLGLDLGEVHVEEVGKDDIDGFFAGDTPHGFLDEHEKSLLDKRSFFSFPRVFKFFLTIRSDLDKTLQKTFHFGFVLMNGDKIVYFRINEQFRAMGLGRQALKALIAKETSRPDSKLIVITPNTEAIDSILAQQMDEWLDEKLKPHIKEFSQMFNSVQAELSS